MTTTEVLALVGSITGPLGFVISLIVFFRDRALVAVWVKYDWRSLEPDAGNKRTFIVQVANLGRRPVHVSKIRLCTPRSHSLLLVQGILGTTLAEGSQPLKVEGHQDNMDKLIDVWWRVRAAADDAARRTYYSDWPTEPPEWAKDLVPPTGAIMWNRLKNWGRRKVF